MYNPTDEDRKCVACIYDNDLWTTADGVDGNDRPIPSNYEVDGVKVQLMPYGAEYLVVTLQEAKEAGVLYHDQDTLTYKGRKWVVVLF